MKSCTVLSFVIYTVNSVLLYKRFYCCLFRDLLLCSHCKSKLMFAFLSLISDLLHINNTLACLHTYLHLWIHFQWRFSGGFASPVHPPPLIKKTKLQLMNTSLEPHSWELCEWSAVSWRWSVVCALWSFRDCTLWVCVFLYDWKATKSLSHGVCFAVSYSMSHLGWVWSAADWGLRSAESRRA